jgi:hypothetical protein
MLILAIFLLALGSVGEIAAVILEIIKKEPIYALMMKVFPWVFGLGAVLLAFSMP